MKITEEMLYECAPEAEKLWLDSLPADDQIPEHTFSRRFERRMKKLIREHKRSLPARRALTVVKRTAAVAFLIAALSFSGMMTVEAHRARFIEIMTEAFPGLTRFTFFSSWSGDVRIGVIDFGYLPAGMTEFRRNISDETQEMTVWFLDREGSQLKLRQQVITESEGFTLVFNTEGASVTTISIGGRDAVLIEKAGITTLMWEDGPYLFILTGEISSEEIIAIADGMTVAEGGNE